MSIGNLEVSNFASRILEVDLKEITINGVKYSLEERAYLRDALVVDIEKEDINILGENKDTILFGKNILAYFFREL